MTAGGSYEVIIKLCRQLKPDARVGQNGPDAEHARESEKIDEVLLALPRRVPGFEFPDQGFGGAEHAMRRDDCDSDGIKDQMWQRPAVRPVLHQADERMGMAVGEAFGVKCQVRLADCRIRGQTAVNGHALLPAAR
jgi:hypothetical protein